MASPSSNTHDIIVIGTSLGGVEALMELVPNIPPDIPAAILVVVHLYPGAHSALDRTLGNLTPLKVKFAESGDALVAGTITLAPPDHHLLVVNGQMMLSQGPRENRTRPAIDPLFRSAAVAGTTRVIGVILTGLLDDGTSGLASIKICGGTTVVQNPENAAHGEMPQCALESVAVDHVVTLQEMGPLLGRLAHEPAGPAPQIPRTLRREVELSQGMDYGTADEKMLGEIIATICPDCGGPLSEVRQGPACHYRCHVGHSYDPMTLVQAQKDSVEYAMWSAVRTLEEQAAMLQRLAKRQPDEQNRYGERSREVLGHAQRIKQFLTEELASNA